MPTHHHPRFHPGRSIRHWALALVRFAGAVSAWGWRETRAAAPLLGVLALPAMAGSEPPRPCTGGGVPPNFVVILADDLGYGDLGVYGNPTILTPRLDQMAAEGLRSTAFYTSPSCTPTRAALMTGAYSTRVGMDSPLGPWADVGLASSEYTVAEMLRDAGYTTGMFGKWHLGDSPDQVPEAQGFDEWLASPWGLPAYPRLLLDSAGPDVEDTDSVYWTPRFTDRTLAFIDAAAAGTTPFFVMLSHTSPHWPATPSPDFVGTSPDGREYGDAVEEIDAGVGRILDRLDALGIANDTLVLFLSDNGPALTLGDYQAGDPGGLRGGKASTFEGGVRSPFLARWPGQVPAGAVSGELLHAVDLFATAASLAGVALPASLPTRDGFDVSAVLTGGIGDPQRIVHHFQGGELQSVRQGPWKLRRDELFDLVADPSETTDLAAAHPTVFAGLEALRAAKEAEVLSTLRPAGATLRKSPFWRAHQGFTGAPTDGATWGDRAGSAAPWRVTDLDPIASFEVVPIVSGSNLPPGALRLDRDAPDVRLERDGSDLGVTAPGSPFSIELWLRSELDIPTSEAVIFECGDGLRGSSLTVGDLGLLGDDVFPGRFDDALVRIGGSTAAAPLTLGFDMPSRAEGWSARFVHLVITYDSSGVARAWVDAMPVAEVTVPGADAGLDLPWSLFGQNAGLGGNGGSGLLPFDGQSFVGEIAAVRVYDRALGRKDVETAICRHVSYDYCAPAPDAQGNRIRFDLTGDFRPDTLDLAIQVEGITGGAWGRLLASREQTRLPAVGGYLCVARRLAANLTPVVVGSGGTATILDTGFGPLSGFGFDADPGSSWNFQLWLRQGGRLSFSNALYVLFCP